MESSKEMEEEASEELDYDDSDYEDTEATIQAKCRVLEKPGSSKDHEARAQSELGARPSSAPLTKRRAVPNPPFDYEPFNYQKYIQQELKQDERITWQDHGRRGEGMQQYDIQPPQLDIQMAICNAYA